MIDKLQKYLAALPSGPITDMTELERLLTTFWHHFADGDHGGMEAWKLMGRMESVIWNPPLLTFTVERHGSTVLGSTRATLQEWTVDLEKRTARLVEKHHRQVRPMQARLDVEALAEEIARLIVGRKKDDRLQWYEDGLVRVLIGEVLPEGSAVKQTLAGRRKRFREAIRERFTSGPWEEVSLHVYKQLPTRHKQVRVKVGGCLESEECAHPYSFMSLSKGKQSMNVDIAVHLFGLPDAELNEYELTGAGLQQYAADLGERLGEVGAVVEKLLADGWAVKIVRNNLEARHPEVTTYALAVARLKRLQIEEDAINDIGEWNDQGDRLNGV